MDGARIKLHCADLGFAYSCTTRLWPYPLVCREIFDDIIHHGFRTENQPLTLMSPPPQEGVTPRYFHYVKGMARSCTLRTLLDGLMDARIRLSDLSVDEASCWRQHQR